MKVLVDMNLPPSWVDYLRKAGHECLHWSSVGHPGATDREIMGWALGNGCVVLTHDLDFGAILAATQAAGPSVIQLRADDTFPGAVGSAVAGVLGAFRAELEQGALISVDPRQARVRILPIR